MSILYKDGQCYRDQLHHKLEQALIAQAKKRDQDPNWIETERNVMLAIVNERRVELGKSPVTAEEIERVEQAAVGHFDYGHKFALYCTELAEDTP